MSYMLKRKSSSVYFTQPFDWFAFALLPIFFSSHFAEKDFNFKRETNYILNFLIFPSNHLSIIIQPR